MRSAGTFGLGIIGQLVPTILTLSLGLSSALLLLLLTFVLLGRAMVSTAPPLELAPQVAPQLAPRPSAPARDLPAPALQPERKGLAPVLEPPMEGLV